uniref:Uncharacterized protein n=1 Tax=Echinococcus granulosus TaxID=6210 RepID=A0A068WUJ6_ECHGR|nr:hypothetical protein EgrG_002046700 [Echinococcus granulosus]
MHRQGGMWWIDTDLLTEASPRIPEKATNDARRIAHIGGDFRIFDWCVSRNNETAPSTSNEEKKKKKEEEEEEEINS